jgi:hypothetical protein
VDATAEDVEDGTAGDLAATRQVLDHVRAPQLVGSLGHEFPLHLVLVDGRVGRWRPFLRWGMPWIPAARINRATCVRPIRFPGWVAVRRRPSAPAGGPGGSTDIRDLVQEVGVAPVPVRRRPRQAVVVARTRDLEDLAGHRDVDALRRFPPGDIHYRRASSSPDLRGAETNPIRPRTPRELLDLLAPVPTSGQGPDCLSGARSLGFRLPCSNGSTTLQISFSLRNCDRRTSLAVICAGCARASRPEDYGSWRPMGDDE